MITLEDALLKGRGKWRSFHCPVHGDNSPSARVNSENGWWVCMSCGAKGHAKNYVADPDKVIESIIELLDQTEMDPKPESWYDIFDSGPVCDHWLSRFSEDACRHYRLGYDTSTGLPCYPVRNHQGRIVGIVRRDPEGKPKYRYPEHFPASHLLWGVWENERHSFQEHNRQRVLVVTEGATDVVACFDAGFNAVGTYGAIMHGDQLSQISALRPDILVLAYDMDEAGMKGAKRAMEGLNAMGFWTVRARWDGGKDLNDLDVETRRETLLHALDTSPL
mgnify:CR=1 FL=1